MKTPSFSISKRRLVLFPLIDVFFMLLIFYLFVRQFQPLAAVVDVPEKAGFGQVNAVLQVMDEDSYVWIDSTAMSVVTDHGRRLTPKGRADLLQQLARDMSEFPSDLRALDSSLKVQGLSSYALLLRCPSRLPYAVASRLVRTIDEVELDQHQYQLQLAVLGGDPEELVISQGIKEGRSYILLDFISGDAGYEE